MTNRELPNTYVEFLKEIAALTTPPRVWNEEIGLEVAPSISFLQGQTLLTLGCYLVEQNTNTGQSMLWHTYADGPDGYQAEESEEEMESNGGWPGEEDGDHFMQHGVDKFSWSLINTLDQALNGFLDDNHGEDFCLGLDADFCSALRHKLIAKLEPLQTLKCECGEFARDQIIELRKHLDSAI